MEDTDLRVQQNPRTRLSTIRPRRLTAMGNAFPYPIPRDIETLEASEWPFIRLYSSEGPEADIFRDLQYQEAKDL